MSERCHNDSLDSADDVCDSCYGSFCSDCLVTLRTKPHPICKECALILSGVRGTRKPKIIGDKKTVKQRRQNLKKQAKNEKYFSFFDDEKDEVDTPSFEAISEIRNSTPAPAADAKPSEADAPQEELLAEPDPKEAIAAVPVAVEERAEPSENQKETGLDAGDTQPKGFDAIEEFDLGLETTSVRHKKSDRMTFATQVEEIPLPEPTHLTIEQLAAAKEEPPVATLDIVTPQSPKDYIRLGSFDKSAIDLANTSYTPKQTAASEIPSEAGSAVVEKTSIRQQIDAMAQPPSHRRLHQKENTAEVPAVLNNVHPSELQREETFETSLMRPEEEKVEAFVGAPAEEELDQRGVYVPPALRGKGYNDSPLPKRRREEN